VRRLNLEYIGQLAALRAWYRQVRLPRIPDGPDCEHVRIVTQAGLDQLSLCLDERFARLRQFLEERGEPVPTLSFKELECPLKVKPNRPYIDHVEWVNQLSDAEVMLGTRWLQSVAQSVSPDDEQPS
jgi:hypothetical protein